MDVSHIKAHLPVQLPDDTIVDADLECDLYDGMVTIQFVNAELTTDLIQRILVEQSISGIRLDYGRRT